MKNLLKNSGWLAIGALALGLSARADVLLQNNTTDLLTRFSDGGTEFGNQIFLANGGFITNFSFEYYAGGAGGAGTSFAAGEHVNVTVRWYLQNGPTPFNGYTTPGTLIYSETTQIAPTTRLTLDYSPGSGDFLPGGQPTGVIIPQSRDLTWTVQFTGLSGGESAGVDLFSGAAANSMYADYWQNNGTVGSPSWELLKDSAGRPITIGQEWMGTAVPEPSILALSLMGGLGLLTAVRRFRNQ
jgi:hypothetical protein